MNFDFSHLKTRLKEIENWFTKELSQVRTGRASSAILDSVQVESYGSKMPINQLATIVSEDPRTLRIAPWDMGQVKEIEKAIVFSNLGVSVAVDDKGIRIFFPDLTTERRTALVKIAKSKLEEAKVTLRKERDGAWHAIQAKEKEGGMGEDEKFRFKSEMEKIIQETTGVLDKMLERKEKEILS